MKNIYSNILSFNRKTLQKTILNLKKGNVVGLPTETVYGLAGNAYLKKAINKIYKMKKRPRLNPLIIHFYNLKDVEKNVYLNDDFFMLYKKFCPGPITFILNKTKNCKIHPDASANLNSIAIRFPKHPITRKILKRLKFPLAMPSANVSSSVSPVKASDVAEELGHKLRLIIDGGSSKIGIESTVIDLTGYPKILRPGIIDEGNIRKILKKKIKFSKKNKKHKSPGTFGKHYSPGIPIFLNQNSSENNCAFITFGANLTTNKNHFNLSKKSNLKEAAANLYSTLRKIKQLKYKKINVMKIPNIGPGIAINDRLKRASK